MLALGGSFRMQFTKEVTHLLTPSSESSKLRALRTGSYEHWHIHAVHPAWIYACTEARRALSQHPFRWPLQRDEPPPCLSQPPLVLNHPPRPVPAQHATFVALQKGRRRIESDPHALQGLKVLYTGQDEDPLPSDAARVLEVHIRAHGGVWVPPDNDTLQQAIAEADVVISSARDSPVGYRALCEGKRLATLEWLWFVSFRGVLTEPTASVLHYPPSCRPIKGMQDSKFSLSGYKGTCRAYLKHLVRLAGAHWSPEITRANTHLLAASKHGPKVAAARAWAVPTVTHRWLEACIKHGSVQPLDEFEPADEPAEMKTLGEVSIDPQALEAWTEEAHEWMRDQDVGKDKERSLKRRRPPSRSESSEIATRRGRAGSAPAATLYYVTTGTELAPVQEQKLRRLGWHRQEAVGPRTSVLVAGCLTRTEKTLCAIARGLPIVQAEWATRMAAQGEQLVPEAFALADETGETQRGVRLADVLASRRARGQGLLAGHTFYLTARVRPRARVMRAIIEAADGTAHRAPAGPECLEADPEHRHLLSSTDDRRAWVAHAEAGLPVWSTELILDGILRQHIRWRRHRVAN